MSPSYLFIVFIALCAFTHVLGDLYMQNPRGNNDRLNEDGDRDNANRLFDSQNNARGGYCYGPPLTYVEGSQLSLEWTAQHSCGTDNTNCNMVIQYMCTSDAPGAPTNLIIRDGTTTNTITTGITPGTANFYNQVTAGGQYLYGMNEDISVYQACLATTRNTGLFTATQQVANNQGAMATRQNPTGTQYGFECTEENDYYPSWHPSPWKDIAVMVNDVSTCPYYQANSGNVLGRGYCAPASGSFANLKASSLAITEAGCVSQGNVWSVSAPLTNVAPDCTANPQSRDNHLGNGVTGQANSYNWTIPTAAQEDCVDNGNCTCVLRMRYNITLGELTGDEDASSNGAAKSPVSDDPTVKTIDGQNVDIALDDAQTGRTFQDRSYMWRISSLANAGVAAGQTVYNVNVRGKRGNIVQTYPATEYDFVPNALEVEPGDAVSIQWTGCDTNPAANAGEGTASTDRSNIVQVADSSKNLPYTQADVDNGTVVPLFTDPAVRQHFALAGGKSAIMNDAPRLFTSAPITLTTDNTDHYFISTRNNNFSNRSQKGSIKVRSKAMTAAKVTGIVVGAIAAVAVGALVGTVVYAKRNPHSRAADVLSKIPGLNRI